MRRGVFSILVVFSLLLTVQAAWASPFEDMDICLGKRLLARVLCKDPIEISYVSKVRDNIYLFSVFYARQEARFVVGVGANNIRIQGQEFLTLTKTIAYEFDGSSKCGIVNYTSPECITTEPLVCCSEKTVEEKLDETFWDRPIPDLLEEDLRKALETQQPEEGAGQDQETQ